MIIKKYSIKPLIMCAAALTFTACNEDFSDTRIAMPEQPSEETPGEEGPTVSSRNEQYRPQIHFTPAINWMNDPNGMVYLDGTWHLYYQYNPAGNDWGNMSWGHATSTDLIHWTEQPVAMTQNAWGDIFSGSCVIDKNNVAGFGANAMIAFYTANGERQQQCMAYSTDGGITFTQYEGNPIIPNTTLADFRDPKVFYHQESQKWIMCLARGWDYAVELWGSSNLKNWDKLSEFRTERAGSNFGQWECPDLFKLPYNGQEKWVMIVSNNPGGPTMGSGTEYFVGSFDGTTFTADPLNYPLWLDYGSDNYAGVTWSNTPDGRTIMIGWMNNWKYCGNVPCTPWRSAMTLPRELTLADVNGSPVLASKVVAELDGIAGEWTTSTGVCTGGDAYQIKVSVDPNETTVFRVGNGNGEYLEIEVNGSACRLIARRNSNSGRVDFNADFAIPSIVAPFHASADSLEYNIYVDKSSVEILSADGTSVLTCLVFPTTPYDRVSGLEEFSYRALKSIW